MQIEDIDALNLSAADDRQIASLMERCFKIDFGGRSFFVQPHHRRYVVRQDAIVGHMGVSQRLIRNGSDLFQVMCVGDVATHPNCRGQGIASALLRHAIAEAQDGHTQFVALFGTAGLYAGHGFQEAPNPIRYVDVEDLKSVSIATSTNHCLLVYPLTTKPWNAETEVDLLGHKF